MVTRAQPGAQAENSGLPVVGGLPPWQAQHAGDSSLLSVCGRCPSHAGDPHGTAPPAQERICPQPPKQTPASKERHQVGGQGTFNNNEGNNNSGDAVTSVVVPLGGWDQVSGLQPSPPSAAF